MDKRQLELDLGDEKVLRIQAKGIIEKMIITVEKLGFTGDELLQLIPHLVARLMVESLRDLQSVSAQAIYRASAEIAIRSAEEVIKFIIPSNKDEKVTSTNKDEKVTPINKKQEPAKKASKKK